MSNNSTKKNIIIIGPAYPLRGGGMATFNERLAREFIAQGHQVKIYTFSLQYPSFLFPGKSQYSTEEAPKDLDIKVAVNSIHPLNWLKVGNEIKLLKPDLVIFRFWIPLMGPCFGTIARQIKKNKFSKIICIADNVIPHEKRPGDIPFTKYFFKSVDGFITLSKKVSEDLKTFAPNKKSVLTTHPLYDNFGEKIEKNEARKLLNLNPEDFVLLFFGFIRKYKGLDLLLESIKNIQDKIPNLKLVVAGEFYEDEQPYLNQIKELNIESFVELHTNFISDKDVAKYFSAADVVVQPYKNATQSGVTPLAYHFEKPLIVTNVGALPDMVPSSVGFVAEPNANSISDSILAMYKANRDEMSLQIKIEKTKYSWEKLTDEIIALSNSLNC